MPITIVATPGAANANSYVTEQEFADYCATRLNLPASVPGVVPLTEKEKKALIESQREFTPLPWEASRVDSVQALAWPRAYAEDPDAPDVLGTSLATDFWFDDDEIPQRLKNAQIELAIEFLRADTTDLAAADQNAGVIEKTVDVLTTRWESGGQRPTGLSRFPRIVALIAPLLDPSASGIPVSRQ